MSVARPSQTLLCVCRRSTRPVTPFARRGLHSTPVRASDDSEDNLPIVHVTKKGRESRNTPTEKWKQQYDERQLEAIKSAKDVIGNKFEQGKSVSRVDPWAVDYYDNFEKIDPVADQPVRAPWSNLDDEPQFRSSDEADAEFQEFMKSRPAQEDENGEPIGIQYVKHLESLRVLSGKPEAEFNPPSAMMPSIPSPPKSRAKSQQERKDKDGDDRSKPRSNNATTPEMLRLMQMTGMDARTLASIRVKTIVTKRVANMTRLGKIYKVSYTSVAGNESGLLGIGEGKADDMTAARIQSQARAIRSMQPIKRYEKRTIFGTVNGKVGATELELYARPPGFGLRCQYLIWEMAKCAGIYDLAARVTRARNPMNTVKAAYQALIAQKDPEDIARARGKKLVDVRKVYYAGIVS